MRRKYMCRVHCFCLCNSSVNLNIVVRVIARVLGAHHAQEQLEGGTPLCCMWYCIRTVSPFALYLVRQDTTKLTTFCNWSGYSASHATGSEIVTSTNGEQKVSNYQPE